MRWMATLALLLLLARSAVAAERVVELATGRAEGHFRVLLIAPAGPPRGAVILLAGGDGSLDLSETGSIRALANNLLVRTRAAYAAAGWLVALPDLPLDIWRARPGSRVSAEHAADLGQVVALLRREAPHVAVVGTSMGSLSAANAAARLAGAAAPDALVLTSGLLASGNGSLNVEDNIPGLRAARLPILLLHHRHDGCRLTPPDGPERLRPMLVATERVDIVMLDGGSGAGNPCEGRSHHGFWSLDEQVVATISGWLQQRW
jgi:dienelactone hydrolase